MHVRGATVVQPVSVPWVELPFSTPLTYQSSAVLVVPLRVAVNTCLPPSATFALEGLRVTVMAPVTVSVAELLVIPDSLAVIVDEPAATPVATPVDAMVAAALLEDAQVTVEVMLFVLLSL